MIISILFSIECSKYLTVTMWKPIFNSVTLVLFVAAFLTMNTIVREVFEGLSEQEQALFRGWPNSWGMRFDRALRTAWNEHTRLFPKRRKRVLFACLLLAAALSVMGYPLWLVLGSR
jgi:hypothetical protein